MFSVLKIPRVQLAFILLFIYLSTFKLEYFYLLLICVGFTVFFDLVFVYARTRKFSTPYSALVSGLIIALIIDPNALLIQMITICGLTVAIKNFIRIKDKHIFNPAAAGLLLGGMIFNLDISWWGPSLSPFFIVLLPALVSAYKMRRFGSIMSFFIIYQLGIRNVLDPTSIFFATVMLPEPKTSPFDLKKQIMYGIIVAILTLILSSLPIDLPDVLIPALLLGNILFFFFK